MLTYLDVWIHKLMNATSQPHPNVFFLWSHHATEMQNAGTRTRYLLNSNHHFVVAIFRPTSNSALSCLYLSFLDLGTVFHLIQLFLSNFSETWDATNFMCLLVLCQHKPTFRSLNALRRLHQSLLAAVQQLLNGCKRTTSCHPQTLGC